MSISRRTLLLLSLVLVVPNLAVADDAELRAIVEKAIAKVGEKPLKDNKGSTSTIKGSVSVNGIPVVFTGQISSQNGTQQHISIMLTVDGQQIVFSSVLNGDKGWRKIGDNAVDMTAEELTEAKESTYSAWVSTLMPLRDKAFKLAPFGEIEIAGRKVVGINVTRDGHRSVNLFFDKETNQLVRTESVVRDEVSSNEVTEESTLSNYKDFNGVQHPTKIVIKRNGMTFADIEVEDYKLSEKLDDSVFAKP
ncbi:MAG: hypothetical protein JSS49_21210 [Planctomycetes bacterium]|nr:hypothetical protein [Planctomycetota bacterium]